MKLLIGLGNEGKTYKNNRHNVGFIFLDWLVDSIERGTIQNLELRIKNENLKFKIDKYNDSAICQIDFNGEKLLLAKPQTFMNESGRAVNKLVTSYKLRATNDVIIIHDDLDIRLGEYKIQVGRGPKLHNGVESIENGLGTKDFLRVRIGIDYRAVENHMSGEAYVLQNFTSEEHTILLELFPAVFRNLYEILHSTF